MVEYVYVTMKGKITECDTMYFIQMFTSYEYMRGTTGLYTSAFYVVNECTYAISHFMYLAVTSRKKIVTLKKCK